MATLLRKSKSIISARPDNNGISVNNKVPVPLPAEGSGTGLFQHFNSIRNRRKSRVDLSTAVESETSAAARQHREEQVEKQHSLTQLRRRLVRKASTFNLHTRHHSSPQKDLDKHRRSDYLFPDVDDETPRPQTQPSELERPSTASTVYSEAAETILHRDRSGTSESANSQLTTISVRRHTLPALYGDKPLPQPEPEPLSYLIAEAQQEILEAQNELITRYPTYREKHYEGLGVWAKMATPGAEPPLPYEKLKQITVEV